MQSTEKDTASVKGTCGPPLIPTKLRPSTVNSTVSTMPVGPEGVSEAARVTLSTRLSGKTDA